MGLLVGIEEADGETGADGEVVGAVGVWVGSVWGLDWSGTSATVHVERWVVLHAKYPF